MADVFELVEFLYRYSPKRSLRYTIRHRPNATDQEKNPRPRALT